MNSKELLFAALDGESTPRVPVIGAGGVVNILTQEIIKRAGVLCPPPITAGT